VFPADGWLTTEGKPKKQSKTNGKKATSKPVIEFPASSDNEETQPKKQKKKTEEGKGKTGRGKGESEGKVEGKQELDKSVEEYKRKRKAKFDSIVLDEKVSNKSGNSECKKAKCTPKKDKPSVKKAPSAPKRPAVKRSVKNPSAKKNLAKECEKCNMGTVLSSANTIVLSFKNGELVSVEQNKSCAASKMFAVGVSKTDIPQVEQVYSPVSAAVAEAISGSSGNQSSNSVVDNTSVNSPSLLQNAPVLYYHYNPENQAQGTSASLNITTVKPPGVESWCEKCGGDKSLFGTCVC
jgi:hypothetical protein